MHGANVGDWEGAYPTIYVGVLLLGVIFNLEGTISPWWQLVLRGLILLLVEKIKIVSARESNMALCCRARGGFGINPAVTKDAYAL